MMKDEKSELAPTFRHSSLPRLLIVNADDLGLSAGTTLGIIEAREHGIVTSASLMVRQPGAADAARYAREHPEFGVGLHVDLGEWCYCEEGWEQAYAVVPAEDAAAIAGEVERQLAAFRELVGRGPTHLDSHQHIHNHEPARSVMTALAARLNLPLRHVSAGITFCGDFYGQGRKAMPFPKGLTVENLIDILSKLPPGISELACHPGLDPALDSGYRAERAAELSTLCDPRVRAAVDQLEFKLISFRDVAISAAAARALPR